MSGKSHDVNREAKTKLSGAYCAVPPLALGHRTVVICGFGGSPFWKHPSPYCRVSRIWGGVWVPIGWCGRLFCTKPRAVKKRLVYCSGFCKNNPLCQPIGIQTPPQIRKTPQYGDGRFQNRPRQHPQITTVRWPSEHPSGGAFAWFWGGSGGGKRAEGTPEPPFLAS